MKKSMYLLSLLAFTIFMLPGCFLLSPQQKEWTLMLQKAEANFAELIRNDP